MSGLSDEQILARLAKIEGKAWVRFKRNQWTNLPSGGVEFSAKPYWNPLENDSQAFALIVKHRIDVSFGDFDGGDRWATIIHGGSPLWSFGESLNRAICLAVIEAHSNG